MAKLWPSLSVLLVVVMLLFLAPSLLLLPGQIVSASPDGVVQEVTANFNFTENVTGNWSSFTAGGGGIQPPGPCLEQYTRANVVRANTNLTNCGFRNYTTGSGNVTGDLSGTLWLSWITFNFSQKYTSAPLVLYHDYGSSAHFGTMMGRGHIDEGGGNNFALVFVADFDSDPTMANAVGKGFMLSADENGTFATHKIIGDFNITKTGLNYTGTFHLRNYDPSEIKDLGLLNVAGGVLQETTDPINTPLALVNYTADGPYITPTDWHTDFEEVAWGRDPIKTVTFGHLGVNGTMDLSRNTALYLEVNATADPKYVRIQGTTACNLYINDTNSGNRTGDGSTYGNLYELLLLYIPDQQLPIGDFFFQNGYTFTPFGMFNPSTQCYAGTESWALAGIKIESSIGNATQTSTDYSYGLYPHPKVDSVFPTGGIVGQTMNVKISGKYFLRAAGQGSGWVANAGSVDFGPNITVNSYSFLNSSPIDNAIIANITINSGAGYAEDVNVTSCFGYDNTTGTPTGTEPYKSGVLSEGFSVVATGATLAGHVNYPGYIQGFNVRLFQAGAPYEVPNKSATTNGTGWFSVSGLDPGTYDIGIKNRTSVSEMNMSVTLNAGQTTTAEFGSIREGDCAPPDPGDDWVSFSDWQDLIGHAGQAYPNADFDRIGGVLFTDWQMLIGNAGAEGDVRVYLK